MRRRFLGQKQSKNVPSSSSSHNKQLLLLPSAVDHSSNRRSFVSGGATAAAKAEESKSNSALMAESKYATIGRFAKKWPWECYRPSPPATVPLPVDGKCRLRQRGGEGGDDEALNGDGLRQRPRSMARANGGGRKADHLLKMSESSPLSPPAHPIAPGTLSQPTSVAGGNNRNSTGSTNSSQASSGFESAKSSSSHHLATSTSSGSCSSGIGSSTATAVLPHCSVFPPNASPEAPASASSRLSSAGSSTQCRSSAYFSISDGLDSSIGPGGTLTVQKRTKEKCPRVNITEMMAKGIPEAEIFAEWLQRLCLSEYLALFLGQGYDLPTLARSSPEDLTTLGITRPEDRKRLFQDIQTWRNLQDNWPTNLAYNANINDWLSAIGLKQYVELFEQQGYLSVGSVEQLESEDLEDIGVKKLGHIKRICLALKKLRNFRAELVDPPLAVCPLHCPPSSSSSVCPLPSVVGIPLDIHSSAFSSENQFVQSLSSKRRNSQAQQSNSQLTAVEINDKNCQRISFTNGISTDGTRLMSKWTEDGGQRVQMRNVSFERDSLDERTATDKGPPRLNLYRTSQIIAQLPRDPPPELDEADEWEDERGTNGLHGDGHHGQPPPPPAPAPFAPLEVFPLALPSSSRSAPSSSYLRMFSSQPTTPRHAPPNHPTFPQPFMDDDQYYQRHLRQRHLLNAPEGSFNAPTVRTEQRRIIMETEMTNLVSKR
ncbi:hypothetical protein niasHS_007423 [Heterodera schachtii]|uniref:SAM domain-containing protein n=1 Tax=Heterodera schachtii TaxID=97005 RepID=A0ABD2JXF9_HETSC